MTTNTALSIDCPACYAKAGEPCTVPTNDCRRVVNWIHIARADAADAPRVTMQYDVALDVASWLASKPTEGSFEIDGVTIADGVIVNVYGTRTDPRGNHHPLIFGEL